MQSLDDALPQKKSYLFNEIDHRKPERLIVWRAQSLLHFYDLSKKRQKNSCLCMPSSGKDSDNWAFFCVATFSLRVSAEGDASLHEASDASPWAEDQTTQQQHAANMLLWV